MLVSFTISAVLLFTSQATARGFLFPVRMAVVPVLIYSLCKGGEIDVKGENHKGAVNLLVKS